MKFDVASDIHLDFWAKWDTNPMKAEKNIEKFIESILPVSPSNILLIPGDLGHYNKQNIIFLKKMREIYKHILFVPGNHDYYMVSGKIKNKYGNNSLNRWDEMKEMASKVEGVHILEGETFTYKGTTFGGCGMWYDFGYAQKIWHDPFDVIYFNWWSISNDSRKISGLPFHTMDMFEKEKEKLDKILKQSDIILTHVGPDFVIPEKYQLDNSNSFYYFNGDPYIDRIKNKLWVFGHTHERFSYEAYGCHFHNCSIGYPDEIEEERKIVTIQK